MIGMLSGSTVRDIDGTLGRVVAWNLPEVKIGWEDDGKLLPREESLRANDPRLRTQLEVLTLDAGWVPLAHFAEGASPSVTHTTIAQMRALLGEADAMPLTEKGKKHWPYKSKGSLGPGPRGGENSQTDDWNCKCSGYRCQCKGSEGQKRTIKINKAYKKAYNKEYKAWRAKQG